MSDWRRVEAPRAVLDVFPNARCWEKPVEDGVLRVLRTVERQNDSEPWRTHVSISHSTPERRPGRYPSWDEQKEAVWRFAPGKPMYSFLPPEGDPYVNVHATTFHWWETTQAALERIA